MIQFESLNICQTCVISCTNRSQMRPKLSHNKPRVGSGDVKSLNATLPTLMAYRMLGTMGLLPVKNGPSFVHGAPPTPNPLVSAIESHDGNVGPKTFCARACSFLSSTRAKSGRFASHCGGLSCGAAGRVGAPGGGGGVPGGRKMNPPRHSPLPPVLPEENAKFWPSGDIARHPTYSARYQFTCRVANCKSSCITRVTCV